MKFAVYSGNWNVCRTLAKHGADYQWLYHQWFWAVYLADNLTTVRAMIVDAGVDVDATNCRTATALHVAVGHGRLEIVQELGRRGANVDATDSRGWTPMHLTVAMAE